MWTLKQEIKYNHKIKKHHTMGKNINPKTLKGKDKHNRVLDLMGRMNTLNESTSLSELDLIKKGPNGVIYGIVRENHKYFIKTTDKKSGRLMAEDFQYIGGLQNKFDESYSSYASATKQLNLKFDMLNESLGIDENNNIFEGDGIAFGGGKGFGFVVEDDEVSEEKEEISEEDEIEEQEYKLKVDAPAAPAAPVAEPSMEEPVEDEVDMGMEDPAMEDPMADMGDEGMDDGEDESDPTKKIQKMTGKIGQMMRDMEEVDTDLEKYVINSVISAMHLDQFSDEDVEDIINKLEGEDEEDDMESGMGDEELPTEEPSMEDPMADEEIPMEEPVMAEESFKIKKSDLVESLTKKILKTNLNESWEEEFKYSGKRANPSKMKKKRGQLKRRNEHHDMDMEDTSTYGEYDDDEYVMDEQMSIDPDMDIEDEISTSAYVDCPRCEGMGCPHCNDEGFHMSGEYDGSDIADDFMTIDGETGEYGPFDRDGDGIASSVDQDDDGDGYLEEMDVDGYGVDVMDSISGSFDTDGDDIPNRLDMDADGDGGLDDEMGGDDLDIEFFSEPLTKPRPTTRPSTPSISPGEKKRKGPWTKPDKKGKPKAGDEGSERRSFRRKGWYK